jgi:hypothetical protein
MYKSALTAKRGTKIAAILLSVLYYLISFKYQIKIAYINRKIKFTSNVSTRFHLATV